MSDPIGDLLTNSSKAAVRLLACSLVSMLAGTSYLCYQCTVMEEREQLALRRVAELSKNPPRLAKEQKETTVQDPTSTDSKKGEGDEEVVKYSLLSAKISLMRNGLGILTYTDNQGNTDTLTGLKIEGLEEPADMSEIEKERDRYKAMLDIETKRLEQAIKERDMALAARGRAEDGRKKDQDEASANLARVEGELKLERATSDGLRKRISQLTEKTNGETGKGTQDKTGTGQRGPEAQRGRG